MIIPAIKNYTTNASVEVKYSDLHCDRLIRL